MIDDPDRWAPAYAEAGAGSVTFHVEAARAPVRLARALRSAGARAGMALKPATPVEPYEDLLPELDMLLLMTVEPGFGGQKFLDVVLPKVRRAREMIGRHGGSVWLQVDGGVSAETIEPAAPRRARTCFVAGSAVYTADDPAAVVASAAGHGRGRRRPARVEWPLRVDEQRAPGSVKVRTGGDSPRPGRSHRPVDPVELRDRR